MWRAVSALAIEEESVKVAAVPLSSKRDTAARSHQKAWCVSGEEKLARDGASVWGREGESGAGWVLLDYGDVIVHIFGPEQRSFYDLEGLWREAVPVVHIQ